MHRAALAVLACIASATLSAQQATPPSRGGAPELYEVAFPAFQQQKGSRIFGFSLQVRGGWVVSITQIPKNWSVWLSMDPACCPKVSGGGHHGADALSEGISLPLRIVVERVQGAYAGELKITGSVETTIDFEKFSSRELGMADMVITRGGT